MNKLILLGLGGAGLYLAAKVVESAAPRNARQVRGRSGNTWLVQTVTAPSESGGKSVLLVWTTPGPPGPKAPIKVLRYAQVGSDADLRTLEATFPAPESVVRAARSDFGV